MNRLLVSAVTALASLASLACVDPRANLLPVTSAEREALPVMPTAQTVQRTETTIFGAWNYTPDASVSKIRGVLRAGFRYSYPPGEWDWNAVSVKFTIDGRDCTDAEALTSLRALPVIDWVNVYWWATFHGAPPPDYGAESIDRTKTLVAQVYIRLKLAGATDDELDAAMNVLDLEWWGAKPIPGATFASELQHAVNGCHLFGQALRAAGFDGPAANYNTNHGASLVPMGGPPNNRLTAQPVPGSMDGRTIFVAGYLQGGPNGCMTETELMDVIAKAPAPLWLALEDNNPGLLRIIRTARVSGKVRLVLLWGNGKSTEQTGDTGNRHREVAKGGSVKWITEQDRAIADAAGQRR